jgi:hypothetical protein
MRHTYAGTPKRHMTVKAAIRYVCERPKKCAARAQGDGTVRWTDVVGSDTMFAFAREPGGTAMSLGSAHGESSKSAMGGTGNPVMRPAFSTK